MISSTPTSNEKQTKRVVFCGVGALGSNAAVACRNLDARLVFVDFDRVESKNLLAQAFVKASVGKNKAEALRLQLGTFWGVRAEAFGVKVTTANVATLCKDADLVVDAFDNAEGRRVLSAWARASGTPLVHAGLAADGTFGLVAWEPGAGGEDGEKRFVADEAPPGAATCETGEHLPLIGVVAATLARVVQDYLAREERRDVMVALHELRTTSTPTPSYGS